MTRTTAVFAVFSFLLIAPALPADEISKNAKIEELLQVTKADQMIDQMLQQIRVMQTEQLAKTSLPPQKKAKAEELQNRISDILSKSLSWGKLKPQYVQLYRESFSEDELTAIVDFYKSPAGKSMLEKMPLLMSKAMIIGQQALADSQSEIDRIVGEVMGEK